MNFVRNTKFRFKIIFFNKEDCIVSYHTVTPYLNTIREAAKKCFFLVVGPLRPPTPPGQWSQDFLVVYKKSGFSLSCPGLYPPQVQNLISATGAQIFEGDVCSQMRCYTAFHELINIQAVPCLQWDKCSPNKPF